MLIEAFSDAEWQLCSPAGQALAAAVIENPEKVVDLLVYGPEGPELTVNGPAARPVLLTLLEGLHHEEWGVRKAAVLALAAIAPEDPDVLAALQASFDDPNDQVRRAAANALKKIGEGRE